MLSCARYSSDAGRDLSLFSGADMTIAGAIFVFCFVLFVFFFALVALSGVAADIVCTLIGFRVFRMMFFALMYRFLKIARYASMKILNCEDLACARC